MASEANRIDVALMYQSSPMPAAMRGALADLGVDIAYEAAADTFDLASLKAAGARAVVISMHGEADATFDTVDQLLADGYALVFNETDVSEALHGYDQARWARHLAAKLHRDPTVLLPLRPIGAEAAATPSLNVVPAGIPAQLAENAAELAPAVTAEVAPVTDLPPLPLSDADLPGEYTHPTSIEPQQQEPAPLLEAAPAPATAGALDEFDFPFDDASSPHIVPQDEPLPVHGESPVAPTETTETPSWSVFQATDINAVPDAHGDLVLTDEMIDTLDFAPADEAADVPPVVLERQDKAAALSFGESELTLESIEEILPEATSGEPAPALQKSSDWFSGKNEANEPVEATASRVADDWALLDFDTEVGTPTQIPMHATMDESAAVDPAEVAFAPDWGLAPLAIEDEVANVDPSKNVIPRVWVLFGSIGTPEALREFLGGLPEKIATLLVVVAPIGADFQAALVTQLSKASALPVRIADGSTPAKPGEVLLLPVQGRVQIKPDGRVLLGNEDSDGTVAEALMRDLVESFGIRAGVILLSGTVNGAIAACQAVADIGGPIWAQHHDSCVISSMVDAAGDAGLVQYSAPPRQLATRLAAICANAE